MQLYTKLMRGSLIAPFANNNHDLLVVVTRDSLAQQQQHMRLLTASLGPPAVSRMWK